MKKHFSINDYSEQEVAQLNAAYASSFETGFIKVGSKVTGTLLTKTEKEAIFTTYGKSNVIVKNTDFESIIIENLSKGDRIDIEILSISDAKNDYQVIGSIQKLKQSEVNEFLAEAVTSEKVLTGVVSTLNHGGYIVDVVINDMLVNIFMPNLLTDVNKLSNPESIVGQEIDFIIEKSSKDGNTSYMASRKKYLQTLIPNAISALEVGSKYEGTITGTTDFAVFIQFNECLTGMIHKSNLEKDTTDYSAGETIEFYVKNVVKDRLFLTQIMRDSLWDSLEVGDVLSGSVSSIKDFGLMLQLDFETKGLIHISNLKGKSPEDYNIGENVVVKVTAINKNNRQITLTLA